MAKNIKHITLPSGLNSLPIEQNWIGESVCFVSDYRFNKNIETKDLNCDNSM